MNLFDGMSKVRRARTKRCSSYDVSGRNHDAWSVAPGETRTLAEIQGPGRITHIWMTQSNEDSEFLRKVLLKMTWDDEAHPSVLVPLGDFFCLGHGMVNSFQSLLFTASADAKVENTFGGWVALNCYVPMPFAKSAKVELINETDSEHWQYFYIDYELYDEPLAGDDAYFHAQFNRENPTQGWGHEISMNTPLAAEAANLTDRDNYLLLEAEGEGHIIGFSLSVTSMQFWHKKPHERSWWGEGDDMIFIDGEPWPPSLHGTGSEDFLNQAFGMQPNAYLFSGSSLYENHTGGYQSSYVFYPGNPIRFAESVRASIEHGHANQLTHECSSVAYWYQREPHRAFGIVPVLQRVPLRLTYAYPEGSRTEPQPAHMTEEMERLKAEWVRRYESGEEKGHY